MIKFRTGAVSNTIERVEVAGETLHFIKFSMGGKDAKRSEWRNYFDTFEEAKDYWVDKAKKRVESLSLQLESANRALVMAKGIKES